MIHFGVWAPDEATFWNSWIGAGICDAERNFLPPYAGCIDVSTSWPGIVERDGEPVPGWHCNVRVWGEVEAMFRGELPTEGTIWETTYAAEVFSLIEQAADPLTGFPAGMRSSSGCTYADPGAFSSPSNVWA